jgi:antitoxin ParD1/3/4
MSTMNISLPPTLKEFVDEQVQRGEYASSSEYVRELIRKDQQRTQLRALLVAGVTSEAAAPATPEYFAALRTRVSKAAKSAKRR